MDAQTRFWVVVLGGFVAAWMCGEVLSLVFWTWMRDRAMLAARLGWLTSLLLAMAAVDQALGLFSRPPVLIGEGAVLSLVILLFVVTYRRRVA